MNRRLLLALFLLLAGVAFWLYRSNTGSTISGPLTDFAVADTSAVDRIFIAEMNGHTADLKRTGPGTWTVNGMPANPKNVQLLLKTFLRVEVRTPVPKASEANVLKVMSSAAKKVEIYMGDNVPAKIWYVGHATQDHYGTYMLLEIPGKGKSSVPFVMAMSGFSGFLTTRFHTGIDDWRSTEVLDYPDLTAIRRVTVTNNTRPTDGWTVTYDGGNALGLLTSDKVAVAMDSSAVKDMMLTLRDQHFEYFERKISKTERDSVMASTPSHVLEIAKADGAIQRVPFWKKKPYKEERNMDGQLLVEDTDRQWALLDDTCLVVVQRMHFDRITLPIQLLAAR